MKKFLKNNFDKIFLVFLFLQPFLDVLTSVLDGFIISVGIAVRMLFLFFIFYYSFFVENKDLKKKFCLFSLIIIYFVLYLFNVLQNGENSIIFLEIQYLFKIFYFPLLLYYAPKIKTENKYLILIMIIYAIFIFLPTVLGFNFDAYTQGKIGSIGWFNSANSISAILSILLPVILVYIIQFKKYWFLYLLVLLPLFMIGSKFTIVALGLSIVFIVMKKINFVKLSERRNIIFFIIGLLLLIASCFVFIPKTSFYKNIVIHAEYLEIESIPDLFTYNSINRFVFSDRLTYLENTHIDFINSDLSDKFLGLGTVANYQTKSENYKLIEMDIFDLFYRLGIIGFVLYNYIIYLAVKNIDMKSNYEYKISLLLIILLSFLVGHTLSEPSVSIFVIVIIFNMLKENCCVS